MEIKGRQLRVNNYLTVGDLETGEVFIFADDADSIWMLSDSDICINLGNGDTCNPFDYDLENKPIRKVKCYLEIEGFA